MGAANNCSNAARGYRRLLIFKTEKNYKSNISEALHD
jgi:hypothetical protein